MFEAEISKVIDDRCRVTLAAILGYKDREVDPFVPSEVSSGLRTTVLREVNLFAEFVADVARTVAADRLVLNGEWLDQISRKIDEMHDVVTAGASETNGTH